MNVSQLIRKLQEIAETDPNAEVRLAVQPSWPFANHLGWNVVLADDGVVYIPEDGQEGYLGDEAKEALGW